MTFKNPNLNDTFRITAATDWPSIQFETDATGPHSWSWSITWGAFKQSGTAATATNVWDAKSVITNFGGTLTVVAQAGNQQAPITVKILGTNPAAADIVDYLVTKPNSAGFDKIIQHENAFKHFNAQNEPDKSFDNGYGMCQLTKPIPTFDQVWNWKLNVDGGLNLFASKVSAAVTYLSQSGRSYTPDQLKYEAVCRWNGGSYHEWDTQASQWVRKAGILCDSATGNIGWDMTDSANKDKTEADLHKRDKGTYRHAPTADAHWGYFGVCYADQVLG